MNVIKCFSYKHAAEFCDGFWGDLVKECCAGFKWTLGWILGWILRWILGWILNGFWAGLDSREDFGLDSRMDSGLAGSSPDLPGILQRFWVGF